MKSDRLLDQSSKVLHKRYKQFDVVPSEKSAKKFIEEVVLNNEEVARYRYLPFIVYNQDRKKYVGKRNNRKAQVDEKSRPISLVAHHDALIYVHYAQLLSSSYENFLESKNITNVPTAYRKEIHKSNINAAKEVFDFIDEASDCWIIKSDFKGFFDNIRHKKLTNLVCEVLNTNNLDADWKAVLKSVTKYRFINDQEIKNLLRQKKLNSSSQGAYVRDRKEFGELVKNDYLHPKGPNQIGIPQGTAISAVLANVYMIKFDEQVNKIVTRYDGLYRRYSDDFVVVVPKVNLNVDINDFKQNIIKISRELTSLEIETDKTKIFDFNKQSEIRMILNRDNAHEDWFDYLGFVYNGYTVKMRHKGIYRFHYKSKRSLNRVIREKNDREQILNSTVPIPKNKKIVVWNDGQKKFKTISSVPKQEIYRKRIKKAKKQKNKNIQSVKTVTRMYLVGSRYGEKYSMVGYAKRAQNIFESGNPDYEVEIRSQIMHQLNKNQQMIHSLKRSS